jgi:hypothetical protein
MAGEQPGWGAVEAPPFLSHRRVEGQLTLCGVNQPLARLKERAAVTGPSTTPTAPGPIHDSARRLRIV